MPAFFFVQSLPSGRVESAVEDAVSAGVRTADIALVGKATVGSREAGAAVVERILSSL